MKLLKLTLKNFKGMKDFTLEPQGLNVSVFGTNATGKTTICDGLSWLLFGRDSLGNAHFEIKTIRNGETVHKLEHAVEGEFSLPDGALKLKKVYTESWPTRRGQAASTFSGHTTKYLVDDVPVKKNEYAAEVKKIASEDIFKLLTSPAYFAEQVHWKERRQILLDVCGDITDSEVIASNEELNGLVDIMAGKTIDQVKKIIGARRKLLNDELIAIPTRVDEVEKGLPEAPEESLESLKKEKGALVQAVEELRLQVQRIESGGEIAEQEKKLADIDRRIIEIENKLSLQNQGESLEIGKKITELNKVLMVLGAAITADATEKKNAAEEIKKNQAAMEGLREEWKVIDDFAFTFDGSDVCPTCKQFLPEEQVEAARATALSNFNTKKAADLEAISTKGVLLKQRNHELSELTEELDGKIKEGQELNRKRQEKIDALAAEQEKMVGQVPDVTDDPAYKTAITEQEAIKKAIADLKAGAKGESVKIGAKIDKANEGVRAIAEKISSIKARGKGEARIAELDAEQKKYSAEAEKLEGQLYLLDLFVRTKVEMMEGKINSRFSIARFKLFADQVNGGLQECCDVVYDGIPYSTGLNNAGKINVGLDIINTLSEHYNVELPVFVDNAESVVQLHPTNSQLIRLVVSGDDKTLRVDAKEAA